MLLLEGWKDGYEPLLVDYIPSLLFLLSLSVSVVHVNVFMYTRTVQLVVVVVVVVHSRTRPRFPHPCHVPLYLYTHTHSCAHRVDVVQAPRHRIKKKTSPTHTYIQFSSTYQKKKKKRSLKKGTGERRPTVFMFSTARAGLLTRCDEGSRTFLLFNSVVVVVSIRLCSPIPCTYL